MAKSNTSEFHEFKMDSSEWIQENLSEFERILTNSY